MSPFAKLRATYDTNWTTILVGWKGLGEFSPWSNRSDDFPSLLSVSELGAYAEERLASSSNAAQEELIVKLLSLDLNTERRQIVTGILVSMSHLDGGNPAFELRKWRLVLLEDLLESLPDDALNGLVALSEFWQSFGFPSDSPHVVQGRGNNLTPFEYYQDENLLQLVASHRMWMQEEKDRLKKHGREAG